MELLYLLLGLIIGLVIFYAINKYKKPVKQELDEKQKQKLEKMKNDFDELMAYSIKKAVRRDE